MRFLSPDRLWPTQVRKCLFVDVIQLKIIEGGYELYTQLEQTCLDRGIDRTGVCLASVRKSKEGRRESKKEKSYEGGER